MTSNYSLEIKFNDNPEAVFYPGQTVKGSLSIEAIATNYESTF